MVNNKQERRSLTKFKPFKSYNNENIKLIKCRKQNAHSS